MKRRTKALITAFSFSTINLFSFIPAFSVEPLAGVSVTLISPKAGTVVNPKLPLTITLQLKGGPAATANKCDQDSLKTFEFGAQVIDANNRAKPLDWGISNVDGRSTGGNLYGWSSKVIPGGIECSIVTEMPVREVSGFASFREGFNENDADWFQTEQTNWSGDITNFASPKKLDIAWKIAGAIKHNTFTATTLGSPIVEILGLTRGQTIDYEAIFQVKGTMSSTLTLTTLAVAVDGRGDRDWAQCADESLASRVDNHDGTITYISNCFISFKQASFPDESIEVKPYLRHNLSDYFSEDGQVVAINVGKQGVPPCATSLQNFNTEFGRFQQELASNNEKFALATSGDTGKKILTQLQLTQNSILKLIDLAKTLPVEVASCNEEKAAIQKNLATLNTSFSDLLTKVKTFTESPALQAKALAQAKARAKKAAAERAAYSKSLYKYGSNLVSKFSVSELNQLGIWRFPSPGKRSLNESQARDWCSQLPRVVIGLPNVVGYPANENFIAGCAAAAMRIRF